MLLAAALATFGSSSAGAAENDPIAVRADQANRWTSGTHEVWLLRGHCAIEQGGTLCQSREAVVWVELGRYGERTGAVTAYLAGHVTILDGNARRQLDSADVPSNLADARWLGRLRAVGPPTMHMGSPIAGEPPDKPAIYREAEARRTALPIVAGNPDAPLDTPPDAAAVQPVQFLDETQTVPGGDGLPPGTRRLRAYGRFDSAPSARIFPSPDNPAEWVAIIDGGIILVIDGLEEDLGGIGRVDSVTIEADRMVIWTQGNEQFDLGGANFQGRDMPLEVYMEGNLVFRQADRVIFAERMFYDVRGERGTVIRADLLTPVPNYQGLLRLHGEVVQQTGPGQFLAQDAFVTSSRMGVPTYRLESMNIFLTDEELPAFDPLTGAAAIDPATGEPEVEHSRLASSYNNFLKVGEVPVLYWPVLVTDLNEPTYYIKRAQVKNDNVFGTQVLTEFDAYQVLGLRKIGGTDWSFSADYLSERGFGAGTQFRYNRVDPVFRQPSPYAGFIDLWAIDDQGLDNLGSDRQGLVPEEEFRYRVLGQHRQEILGDFQLSAELGLVSDRNFLEQYYENEWDEFKDQTTGLELKRTRDNTSWSVNADVRLNEFFMQTEWLPRADHFWLGQSLLGDTLTWYEHSQAGYGRLRAADPPEDATELAKFTLLPYEAEVEGERLVTRQELDLPVQLGPFKFVPYVLGELAHWGEALDGDDLQRAYGQAGLRVSLPMWAANPYIESPLLNLHGVAHKVVFDTELLYADATADIAELPLYDPLDDDNIEQFRRRFAFNTFGGPFAPPGFIVPPEFDERFYALRSGLGGWVTSPSTEIADDLTAMRFGVRQRWQTKRGPPEARRIIDWIVLDTQATLFPDEDRDNFGESLGLAEYNFRWHVGDRVTLLSSGIFDFFDGGQEIANVGAYFNTLGRSSFSISYSFLGGPIDREIVNASVSYRLSPKWLTSLGTSLELGGDGNIGQNASFTRIGESFLVSVRVFNDASKDNLGVSLLVEPRFLPARLGSVGGATVPPAGAMGLE
jgi:hypothetical protein